MLFYIDVNRNARLVRIKCKFKKFTSNNSYANFKANGGSNPEDIDVTDKYIDIPEDERYVYVQYRTSIYNYWYTYYVAEVKLEDLLKGQVDLNFEEFPPW